MSDETNTTTAGTAPTGYFDQYYSDRDFRFYSWLLAKVIERAEPGPILDLGAGAGFFVEAADRWGLDCCGVEASAEGVAIARRRYPPIRLEVGNLADPLPFDTGTFGCVLLNQVIEHLPVHVGRHTLGEVHRVLRPGGMVFITSPSRFNRAEREADPTHISLYTPSGLRETVKRAGFGGYVDMNVPLPIFGTSAIGRLAVRALWRLTRAERLSSTANCIAYKPSPSDGAT